MIAPTRCHECGERTETWVLVYLSDFDRVPCCLACCRLMGWLPEGGTHGEAHDPLPHLPGAR